ncbi:hypothetical protein AB0J57_07955 [Streptomyces sp. NPDC049837]|uniref:hypothetical protein n=1 Tax=Streptomyces sp. NPDC049837 TaxID=3155277 RepID=UPI003433886D
MVTGRCPVTGNFLALGVARGLDIASIGDLWRDKGALGAAPGGFGHRVVQLALATGGVPLAVSLSVPGMPVAFTLAGALVPPAGAGHPPGGRRLDRRGGARVVARPRRTWTAARRDGRPVA